MRLNEALTERLRRVYEWSESEIRSEYEQGYPVLKTISSPNVATSIQLVDALEPEERLKHLLLLTRTADPFRIDALGQVIYAEDDVKAKALRKTIFVESSRSVSLYAFTITADLRPKKTALSKECKKILKDLTGDAAVAEGKHLIASSHIGDWSCRLSLQRSDGNVVLSAYAIITRSDSNSLFIPYNLRGHRFGYAEQLGCGNTSWLMNDVTDVSDIVDSVRQVCARTLDAFAYSVKGLNIDD